MLGRPFHINHLPLVVETSIVWQSKVANSISLLPTTFFIDVSSAGRVH